MDKETVIMGSGSGTESCFNMSVKVLSHPGHSSFTVGDKKQTQLLLGS